MAVCVAPLGAQRWQMQYLYDQMKSDLIVNDLQCPSATHCAFSECITIGAEKRGFGYSIFFPIKRS